MTTLGQLTKTLEDMGWYHDGVAVAGEPFDIGGTEFAHQDPKLLGQVLIVSCRQGTWDEPANPLYSVDEVHVISGISSIRHPYGEHTMTARDYGIEPLIRAATERPFIYLDDEDAE